MEMIYIIHILNGSIKLNLLVANLGHQFFLEIHL